MSDRAASSLRTRLILGVLLIVPPMLIAGGVLLDFLMRTALTAQFDSALDAGALSLALLVEQDEEGLDFELKDVRIPEFEPAPTAAYFQIRVAAGNELARSNSLESAESLLPSASDSPAVIVERTLANGVAVRRVLLRMNAKQDEEFAQTGAAPVVIEVALARPVAALRAAQTSLRLALLGVGGLVLAALVALLTVRVNRELRPLGDLSSAIAGIASESLATRLSIRDLPAEVVPVVERLNDLLGRVEAAFERERRFTSDAAHELRTPLAGVRATVEVALLRERPIEEYREALRTTLGIVIDLQHLVEALLQLARVGTAAPSASLASIDPAALLRDCWNELSSTAGERGIRASFHLDNAERIESDPDLLRIAIRNLLRNAAQHADESSEVTIQLVSTVDHRRRLLAIENSCRALRPADLEHVFDRFWRREQAHGVAADRYGIGLPLARAVLQTLGATIRAILPRAGVFRIEVELPNQHP